MKLNKIITALFFGVFLLMGQDTFAQKKQNRFNRFIG